MRHAERFQNVRGALLVGLAELLVWPKPDALEQSRQNYITPGDAAGIFVLKIAGDDAEMGAQIPQIPFRLAKNPYAAASGALSACSGVDFARQQLQQRRFAGAVGAENHRAAMERDFQRQLVEDFGRAAKIGRAACR